MITAQLYKLYNRLSRVSDFYTCYSLLHAVARNEFESGGGAPARSESGGTGVVQKKLYGDSSCLPVPSFPPQPSFPLPSFSSPHPYLFPSI